MIERKCDYKIVVHSLIGGNQLTFYLRCLHSLLEYCEDSIELQLHTDGSLSNEQKDSICEKLSDYRVLISDSDRNTDHILDCLEDRPNCQNFRKKSIWGVEFFDPLFTNPEEPISFYLDADILFLRPFSGLFDNSQTKGGAVFLKDTQWDAYCFRPWSLLRFREKPEMVKGITTGLVFWDKEAIDWDYLEWFLGASYLHKIPEWIIPTAQAGLAKRCLAKTVCHNQITNLYPNAKISEDTFGVHLLGSYRKSWLEKLDANRKGKNQYQPTLKVDFDDCENQSFIGYSLNQVKRWKNTRLNFW
jgi:hypothetical protein